MANHMISLITSSTTDPSCSTLIDLHLIHSDTVANFLLTGVI
jgi:hypothetical protein